MAAEDGTNIDSSERLDGNTNVSTLKTNKVMFIPNARTSAMAKSSRRTLVYEDNDSMDEELQEYMDTVVPQELSYKNTQGESV